MGVSILEGKQVERIATALEAFASAQDASEIAREAAREAREAVDSASDIFQRLESVTDNLDTLENLAEGLEPSNIGAVSYQNDQTVPVYEEDGETVKIPAITPEQQAIARANIGLADINALTSGNVKYAEAQELQEEEKATARSNIDAASAASVEEINRQLEDVDSLMTGAVRYDVNQTVAVEDPKAAQIEEQIASLEAQLATLEQDSAEWTEISDQILQLQTDLAGLVKPAITAEQQAVARTNIGAASATEMATATQNIATIQGQLGNIDSLVTGTVKYSADQTQPVYEPGTETVVVPAITPEEQAVARTNIGAASATALAETADNLSTISQIVNAINTNVQNGGFVKEITSSPSGLTITYSDNQEDTVEIAAGIASVDYDKNNDLHFYDSNNAEMFGGPFRIQGGGGGGSGYTVRIANGLGTSTLTVAANQIVILPLTYTEYYGGENTNENGYMTVQHKKSTEGNDAWVTMSSNVQVGSGVEQRIDVSSLMEEGKTTNIRVLFSNGRQDEDAINKTVQFNIACVAMNISTTFDASATYTGNLNIPYTCVGRNLQKTVYLQIDGQEYTHVDVGTSHNQSLLMAVSMNSYTYGAHRAKLWFETPDGAKSNVIDFVIIYDNGASTDPIIAMRIVDDDIENGEKLELRYTCYTPGKESTDELSVRVYAIVEGLDVPYYNSTFTNIPNNREQRLIIDRYPEVGKAYVEYTSGTVTDFMEINIREISTKYNVKQVDAGLVYSYRPVGATNSANDKDIYTYELVDETGTPRNIYTKMRNFNWVTDGYLDGDAITMNGSARMNIDLPIFTTAFENEDGDTVVLDAASGATVTSSGRTVEFEFELSNVTDQNSTVFKCMNENGVGFVITPQVCYLCSDGQAPSFDSTGFIQNEESIPCAYIKDEKRIRVAFVIQRKKFVDDNRFASYANIFINGEYANSYLYNQDAVYTSEATIAIGSNDCTTKLYDVRIYNRDLDDAEILQNYMNANADVRVRIANNEYNDVLDSENRIDYNLAKYKYPCLLFIGPLSNFKADKKNVGVVLTKPDGRGSYTTEFSLLDKNEKGAFVSSIKVQGTSSQRFMRKNFKVSLAKAEKDEQGNLILDEAGKAKTKKVKYVLKGYDENGNPNSIGESTLCFKMDYMSTDHANTFNANIADTLFKDKATAPVEYSPNGTYEVGARVMHENDPYECIVPIETAEEWNAEHWKETSRYWLVQDTIWGFRCLLFDMPLANYTEGTAFDDYPEGAIEFAGDGCLNNDKGNSKSFGLESEGDVMDAENGLDTLQQKWEFKDNSQPICSFKTDRFMQKVYSTNEDNETTYVRAVKAALESCYPDEGDLGDEGLEPNYDHIQILFSWVCQRANFINASTVNGTGGQYNGQSYRTERDLKKAIFINEFTQHFNLEHALVYYLFIEWVALCDNRAKNMFLSCKDIRSENIRFTGGATSLADCIDDETGAVDISKIDWANSKPAVWYTDLYDLDSCFGAENSGYIRIPYYADWNFQLNGNYQFNGHDSILWCMFEEAFANEIQARAKEIVRSNTGYGALNYNVLKQVHITDNAELVCPAIVNEDMEYKYEDAWTKGYYDYSQDSENPTWVQTNDYKYLQRGSRTEQKESFIYRRSNMLYSKYQCDPFLNDQLNFRCGVAVSAADSTIELKPVQAMWCAITYGDSGVPQSSAKKAAGETATIVSPTPLGRSDNIHIHGASNLTSVSSLAKFQPYEIGLTGARKLKTLLIGSNEEGYSNSNLTSINTSNCTLLETLNMQNCTGFSDTPVNLRSNSLIRKVYAGGSTIPYFSFADGGILDTLELGTPTRIELRNQPYLENFSYDSLDRLTFLRVEGTPNVGIFDILNGDVAEAGTDKTHKRIADLRLGIRLVDIDETITDRSIFTLLTAAAAQGKRMDASGNLVTDKTAYPVITGTIHCDTIGAQQLADMNEAYPNLVIDYVGDPLPQFAVHFVNPDGTTVKDRKGNDYIQYIDQGGAAYDPVEAGEIDPPTMEPDAQSSYEFNGTWLNLAGQVQTEKTVTAQYNKTGRSYTVRWFLDKNYTTPLKQTYVRYGTEAVYDSQNDSIPSRTDKEGSYTYQVFDGWDKSTGFVTEDMDVYAKWKTAALPTPKYNVPSDSTSGINPNYIPLSEMDVAQIYAVSRFGNANQYWELEDYVDIQVGADFDFENVESKMLAQDLYLDRTRIVTTNERLFTANGPSFTLAIDYEFADAGTGNDTLVSCYNGSGSEGFRLFYSNSGYPTIGWGDKQIEVGNYGMKRGMVVLLYIAGQNNLYVVSNNVGNTSYNMDVVSHEAARSQPTTTDATLVFGGTGYANGTVAYGSKGMIHWCKLWYGNLGNTVIRKLANWTHEKWRMKYTGEHRYYPADGSGFPVSATFITDAPLMDLFSMSNANNGQPNGWDDTRLNTFVNSRCFKALPVGWQQIIKPVNLTVTEAASSSSYNNFVTKTITTKIHLPAYVEISSGAASRNNRYGAEGTTIPWFTDNVSRVRFAGIQSPADHLVIRESSDPSAMTITYANLRDGDIWINTNNGNYAYVYVSPEEAAKHSYLGARLKTSGSNIQAATGGVWVLAEHVWTRTPGYYGYYFYHTDCSGSMQYNYYGATRGIMLMFSI